MKQGHRFTEPQDDAPPLRTGIGNPPAPIADNQAAPIADDQAAQPESEKAIEGGDENKLGRGGRENKAL